MRGPGIPAPLLPLFSDPSHRLGRDLLVEPHARDGNFSAIRTPRYLYAEYWNGERELYDLSVDRHQLESRHDDPAYAAVQAELANRLARLRTCAGETCRTRP
jgi:N-acetylglucosamine-6-sulfatase